MNDFLGTDDFLIDLDVVFDELVGMRFQICSCILNGFSNFLKGKEKGDIGRYLSEFREESKKVIMEIVLALKLRSGVICTGKMQSNLRPSFPLRDLNRKQSLEGFAIWRGGRWKASKGKVIDLEKFGAKFVVGLDC